jgi:hypothetical protein
VKAIGAEATRSGMYEAALENDWYKAEWCVNSAIVIPDGLLITFGPGSSFI